jgi:hypothetical protein
MLAHPATVHKPIPKQAHNNHTALKVFFRPLIKKRFFLEQQAKEFLKVPQIALF